MMDLKQIGYYLYMQEQEDKEKEANYKANLNKNYYLEREDPTTEEKDDYLS